MKAIYQKPTTEQVLINTDLQLMQASKTGGLLGNGDDPNDLDLGNAGGTGESSGNLSRRRDLWEDEEEEEY